MPRLPRRMVAALVRLLQGPIAREGLPPSARALLTRITFPGERPKSLAKLLMEQAEARGAIGYLDRPFPEPLLPGIPDYTAIPYMREKLPELTREDIAGLIKAGGRPHAYFEGLGDPKELPMSQAQILWELIKMAYERMP